MDSLRIAAAMAGGGRLGDVEVNNQDVSIQVMLLPDFKLQLKKELKPMKYKHFSKGSKLGNSLLSRIRLNRSDLNLHKFDIGLHETSECSCHAKSESSIHYMMDCFLYSGERQNLSNLVEHVHITSNLNPQYII